MMVSKVSPKKLFLFLFLLLSAIPLAAGFTPPDDFNGRGVRSIYGVVYVNSTYLCIGTPLTCIDAWSDVGSTGPGGSSWNITGSKYLVNASGILAVDEAVLNATIDAREKTNTTVQMRNAVNNSGINIAGSSNTALALSYNPSNCAANTYPLGVNASGGAESCTTDRTNTSVQIRAAINTSTLRFVSSAVATSDSAWTSHNSYPASCSTGSYVNAIGDTNICAVDKYNTTTQVVAAVNNSAYRFVFKVPRSSIIQNWAACPLGSSQYNENETGRYCDANMMNTTEISSLYVQKAAPVMTKNVSFNGGESDFYLNFYEDGSSTGESIYWENAGDKFIMTDALRTFGEIDSDGYVHASGNLYSDGDIYTTGSGDDLWLGTSTQSSANTKLYANGTIVAKNIVLTNVTVSGRVYIGGANTYLKSNGTCITMVTPTANMSVGC